VSLLPTVALDAAAAIGIYVMVGGGYGLSPASALIPNGLQTLRAVLCLFSYAPSCHHGESTIDGGPSMQSAPSCRWAYRGAISNDRPSEVIPLQWPAPDSSIAPDMATQPGQVQLGFSLEPLSELHPNIHAHVPSQSMLRPCAACINTGQRPCLLTVLFNPYAVR